MKYIYKIFKKNLHILTLLGILCYLIIGIGKDSIINYSNYKMNIDFIKRIESLKVMGELFTEDDSVNPIEKYLTDYNNTYYLSKDILSNPEKYGIKEFILYQYLFTIDDNLKLKSKNKTLGTYYVNGSNEPKNHIMMVNKNALEGYGIKVDEGRNINQDDFDSNELYNHNVIVGNSFKEYYKIGDTFKIKTMIRTSAEGEIDEFINCKIVGFIKKDSPVILTPDSGEIVKSNETIIFPENKKFSYRGEIIDKKGSMIDYFDGYYQPVVFDEEKYISGLNKYANSQGIKGETSRSLIPYYNISMMKDLSNIKEEATFNFISKFVYSLLLIIVILGLSIAIFLKINRKDIGVCLLHMSKGSLYFKVFVVFLVPLVIGAIGNISMLKIEEDIGSLWASIGVTSFIYIVFVSILIYLLSKKDLDYYLRVEDKEV